MIASACPDQNHLSDYLLGRVKDHEAENLESHLSGCSGCLKVLGSLRPDDVLLSAIRTEGHTSLPSNQKIEALRSRMEHLFDEYTTRGGTASSFTVLLDKDSDTKSSAFPVPVALPVVLPLAPAQGPGELGRLGTYRVLEVLGSGGMGMVLKAEDPALKRLVALKVMRAGLAENAEARERFLREGRAMAALSHDHIVSIYQVGEDRGIAFLAMPLLQGEMLETRLRREVALPLGEALRIGRETALGLATAHERGMIHRDIKPGNLWLEAPQGRVKILDFGLARQGGDGDPNLTDKGTVLGTPAYMAPEQADGKADHRADLFSLGCVLYRLTTGRLPFEGSTTLEVLRNIVLVDPPPPHDINPEVPAEVGLFIKRLLEKEPSKRPVSAAVVARVLDTLQQKHAPIPVAIPLAPPVAVPKPEPVLRIDSRTTTAALDRSSTAVLVPTPAVTARPLDRLRAWIHTSHGISAATVGLAVLLMLGWIVFKPGKDKATDSKGRPSGIVLPGGGANSFAGIFHFSVPEELREPLPPIDFGQPMTPDALVSRPEQIKGLRSWDWSVQGAYANWNRLGLLTDGRFHVMKYGDKTTWLHVDFLKSTFGISPLKKYDALSPDQAIYLDKSENLIFLNKAANGQRKHTLRNPSASTTVHDARFSPSGKYVGSVSDNHFVLWTVDEGRVEQKHEFKGTGTHLSCSADGNWWVIAIGTPLHATGYRIVNVKKNWISDHIPIASGSHNSQALRLSPDGSRVLVQQSSGVVQVLNTSNGKEQCILKDAMPTTPQADWSPDGKYIAYPGQEQNILIADVSGEEPVRVGNFRGHGHTVLETIFAQDGKTLISIGDDGTIRFWNLENGTQRGAVVMTGTEWFAVSAEGHFKCSPGFLPLLNVRVQPVDGMIMQISYEKFIKDYGWTNKPEYVRFLDLTQTK